MKIVQLTRMINFFRFSSKTLQQLSRERDELEKVFRLAESLENQKRDEEKTKKLQDLITTKGKQQEMNRSLFIHLADLDQIQSDIQSEKTLTTELDIKLREWEKKIKEKQAETGGANVAVTFNANVRKQERVLENRLDTVGRTFIVVVDHRLFDRH